jgi:DNA-binding response OmpR family regulator
MQEKTILVIDDEEEVLTVIRKRLEMQEYKVATAVTAKEGLKKASEIKPALILLDIMMPGIDGLEVLRLLKSNNDTVSIPVVMLTAKSESKVIFEAEDMGAVDYIIKPYDSKELLELVAKYV